MIVPAPSRLVPAFILLVAGGVALNTVYAQDTSPPGNSTAEATKGAPYVSTPQQVVLRMFELADVTDDDVVYDLGSGDGRFVISAARDFGARGVGIEIDADLVEQSRRNATRMRVADRTQFHRGDLFETDLSSATVVTLYLWPDMINRLRPKLLDEMAPGTRVVSHDFTIKGWTPDTTVTLGTETLQENETQIHVWTIPE